MGDQIIVPETRRYAVGAVGAGLGQFAYNQVREHLPRTVQRIANAGFNYLHRQGALSRFQSRLGPYKPGMKRPRTAMVKSGGNVSHGFTGATWTGKVYGKSRKYRPSKVTKTGYRMESEVKGIISDLTTARVAITAYPVDEMLVGVWIAVLRYMFKKVLNVEFSSVDQFIEIADNLRQLEIEYVYTNSKTANTSSNQQFLLFSSSTTLKQLATQVARQDLFTRTSSVVPGVFPLPYRLRFQATNAEIPGLVCYPSGFWFRIDKLLISLYGKAEINVQNATLANNNIDTTTAVTSCPITGNIVFGKGQTVQPVTLDATNAISTVANDFPFNYETAANGVIVAGAVAANTWRAVQPATQFSNTYGSKAIHLNPGETKTQSIGYKWKGYLTTFLEQYYKEATLNETLSPTTNDSPIHQGADSGKPGLNKFALFQFEKRVDVTSVSTRIWYQVDFHFGVRVVKGVRVTSMNTDFKQFLKSSVF